MALLINTNSAATNAAMNLNNNNSALQKSLARLSSGSKIVNPADDAGGLAVSMRMSAAIKRTDATSTNIANAVSFLQTQDGALSTAGKILNRISELKTLSTDVTKNTGDTANYDKEYKALKQQLSDLTSGKFNGVDLFGGTTQSVGITEDGAQNAVITQSDLATKVTTITSSTSLDDLDTIDDISQAITDVAEMRAENGAEASNLGFATDMLAANKTNLEAANSRIVDVDVAQESTQMAKNNILVQASAAMLSQANQSSQVALKLLQG
ncbi:MAG: flagellin [Chthoniobacteraceae bacterium]|nr:flagellin [Chthoniobacteraceae bacterium]